MAGCGIHNQPPGTWSDDTSLTLCLADSLSRGFNLDDIARNVVAWHDEAAFTARGSVFDIGISTAKAVRSLKAGSGRMPRRKRKRTTTGTRYCGPSTSAAIPTPRRR
jgi:ADP-ribosylglycohydrolase